MPLQNEFDRAFSDIDHAAFELQQRCCYRDELVGDLKSGGPNLILEVELFALQGELRRCTDVLADRIETLRRLLGQLFFGVVLDTERAEKLAQYVLVLVTLPRLRGF